MIAGATRGAGGPALGRHLASAGMNEHVITGESRGLMSEDIGDQVAELTRLGSHARTQAPVYHVHADPPEGRPWDDADRARYWELFEKEFGLERQPFASVVHVKGGREHEHRAYLRTRPDGTAIRLDHDFARREKLSRIMEHERGEPFTRGAHNRTVITALKKDGREDVADAMRAAGLHEGPRARAGLSPTDRAQQERTHVAKAAVAAAALAAWRQSDTGPALLHALAAQGLRLAAGDKPGLAVVLDGAGGAHSLARLLAQASKAEGGARLPAADVAARLDGMVLPTVAQARQAIAAQPSPPDDGPPSPGASPPPGGGQDASGAFDVAHAYIRASHGQAAPTHAATHAVPGVSLEDAGPGPGEPPAADAHPEELARYRAALAAYEDRKAAAWARWVAAQGKQDAGAAAAGAATEGGHHGIVQQVAECQPAAASQGARDSPDATAHATGPSEPGGAPGPRGDGAEPGHDGAGGAEDTGHLRPGEGREHAQQPSREPVAADNGARPGGERGPRGGEGAAGGHRGAADSPGGQAGQDRSAACRAARGLATLSVSALRDRLDPARAAVREAERIRAGSAHRTCDVAPGIPEYTAAALDRLMERVDARDPATLADLRHDGFHEVLRMEKLRVLLAEDQAARAGLGGGPHAAERWTPATR